MASQFFDYEGEVEEVLPVQTFPSGFTKRDLIINPDRESRYPNYVKFTFKKDNCALLDSVTKGQKVKVHFAIDGRKWEGAKGVQYFVDLTAIRLEVMGDDGSSTEPMPEPASFSDPVASDELDDMPF